MKKLLIFLSIILLAFFIFLSFPEKKTNVKEKQQKLLISAKKGKLKSLKSLLSKGFYINTQDRLGNTPLMLACENGREKAVKFLIDSGALINKTNAEGLSALHLAAKKGHENIVKTLLANGAIVNQQDVLGYTPFYWACFSGKISVVKLILANKGNLFKAGRYNTLPIHESAYQGHIEILQLLVGCGADVNQSNAKGITPLHFAVMKGKTEMVKLLIELGADVNQQTKEGCTALHYAAAKGHLELIRVLLENNAKIDRLNRRKQSALHSAILNKRKEAVCLLLHQGAEITLTDEYGSDAIFMAVSVGDKDILELLIDIGNKNPEDLIPSDKKMMTPLYYTRMFRKKNHKSLSRLLKQHCPILKEVEKEHIHLKRLGHAWKIDGIFTIEPKFEKYPKLTVKVLGGRSNQFFRTMAKGTKNYVKSLPKEENLEFYAQLFEMLTYGDNFYEYNAFDITSDILKDYPVPIHIGWEPENHQIELLLWKSFLILSNRGVGSRKPIEIFRFNPKCLNKNNIQLLLNLDGSKKEDFEEIFFTKFGREVQLKKSETEKWIEENVSLAYQTVDNCAWESVEGIVYALFILDKLDPFLKKGDEEIKDQQKTIKESIQKEEKKFYRWLAFQKLDVLDRYLVYHNDDETPYKRNMDLLSTILKKLDALNDIAKDKFLSEKLQKIEHNLQHSEHRISQKAGVVLN